MLTAQQTLKEEVVIEGQALHSGKMVSMRLIPQSADTGIFFRRKDLPGEPLVRAEPRNVVSTFRCLSLGTKEWRIQTIEHLMAALHGLEVDNLLIEVSGEELPLGDGSAWFFTKTLLKTGLASQDKPRLVRRITSPVWVENGNDPCSYLLALPGEGLRISYCFTSNHRMMGDQFTQFLITPEVFQAELAKARTIAFTHELEALRSQGLALGGNMDVAVVVGENGYLNTLNYPDEIARHKILDILGDLYLLGPVEGQIIGIRSGHKMDHELTMKLEESWK